MVQHTLARIDRFANAELVDGFFERCIDLGDGRKPSQADVLAVLALPDELAIMVVEGKVDESFGPLVSEWLIGASAAKLERLRRLCATLNVEASAADPLRYQLFHRTASEIYEAHPYRVRVAIMMVHSFDPNDAGVPDSQRFAAALGLPAARATHLLGPVTCEGVDLYLGLTADWPSNEGFVIVDGRETDDGFQGLR